MVNVLNISNKSGVVEAMMVVQVTLELIHSSISDDRIRPYLNVPNIPLSKE
jgi:hypothetical protein